MPDCCCICKKDVSEELSEFLPWQIRKCKQCGLVYMNDVYSVNQRGFSDSAFRQLHDNPRQKTVEYWSFPEMYNKYKRFFDGYFANRLNHLRQHHSHINRVLDVGCGYGFFMNYLKQQRISTAGVDIDRSVIEYAKSQFNLDVLHAGIDKYSDDGTFDAIVACDVLEHVPDPCSFLEKCHEMLAEDGVLYVQTPNVLGDTLPSGGSYNWPWHLWQFDPKTLERLLTVNGFEVIQWWTGVMGVIGVLEAGGPDEATQAMWRRATRQKRGNRLQMIARPYKMKVV